MTTTGMVVVSVLVVIYLIYNDKQEEKKSKRKSKLILEAQRQKKKEIEEFNQRMEARPEEVKAREQEEGKRRAIESLKSNKYFKSEEEKKEIEDMIKLLISKFSNMEISSKFTADAKKASVQKWKLLLKASKLPMYAYMNIDELNHLDLNEVYENIDKRDRPWKYFSGNEMPVDIKEKYLQSNEWRKLKSRRLKLANNKCEAKNCSNTKNLDLHHIDYDSLGHEDINDVRIVCRKCHNELHELLGYNREGYFPI